MRCCLRQRGCLMNEDHGSSQHWDCLLLVSGDFSVLGSWRSCAVGLLNNVPYLADRIIVPL